MTLIIEEIIVKIVSLFSGCGGLDLGFIEAGFKIVFANDNDKNVIETYEKNHNMKLDTRSITDIASDEIPQAIGVIGGPPCQSWSIAGNLKGINDNRGKLFYEYARVLRDKKPLFFVAENVPGILYKNNIEEFNKLIELLESLSYKITYQLVDSRDYGVPQSRSRVIIIGFKKSLDHKFVFPRSTHSNNQQKLFSTNKWLTLKDAISDLPEAKPGLNKTHANDELDIPNHEYMLGSFSSHYMSRNRRRNWNEQSFTIQAGGRHAPLHPDSSEMIKVAEDLFEFKDNNLKYRRLSVRECARLQTFPDDFIFYYKNLVNGYKMVGNAVPVKLAAILAKQIMKDLLKLEISENNKK